VATPTLEVLLTIEQAAEVLAVNERMVRRLVETRRIAFVKVGRHVRFRESDLLNAMQAWTIQPSSRVR
jgi:excisionase family DNA binding protein